MEFSDDPHPDSPVEWENNWLSNFLAAASQSFLPNWCQTPEHWTSKIAQTLWTDCPCCLLFRGITVGLTIGILINLITIISFMVIRP
jgi:hypothetical protein